MPFSFVVEDGSGLANATSYVSVVEADDYYTIDPAASALWATKTNTEKQYALAWATRYLDQKTTWKGNPVKPAQALRWPRTGVYDRDRRLIQDDEIPEQVKEATFELTKFLLQNDPTPGQDVDNIQRVVVDVIEIEFQEGAKQTSFPILINDVVQPLGIFRIGNRGFGKIVRV